MSDEEATDEAVQTMLNKKFKLTYFPIINWIHVSLVYKIDLNLIKIFSMIVWLNPIFHLGN